MTGRDYLAPISAAGNAAPVGQDDNGKLAKLANIVTDAAPQRYPADTLAVRLLAWHAADQEDTCSRRAYLGTSARNQVRSAVQAKVSV